MIIMMKGIHGVITRMVLAALVAGIVFASNSFAQNPQTFPNSKEKYDPTNSIDRKELLLETIKNIADQKGTMDLEAISHAMGTNLTKITDAKAHVCQYDNAKAYTIHQKEFWYHSIPGEMTQKRIRPRPYAASTGTVAVNPTFYYCETGSDTYYIKGLNPNHTVGFNDIMAYACISITDLQGFMPKVHMEVVMDGPYTFGYTGYTDDFAGIRATFVFFDNCLDNIKVEQKAEDGFRFRRALANFSKCKIAAMDKFCSNNTPPLDPAHLPNPSSKDYKKASDAWMVYFTDFSNRSDEFVKKECGTLTDFYNKEPLTGLPASGPILNYGEPPSCKKR